uniref:PA domain-containing protein n=1 Tax=Globisporangium ultimum (strain ATCC 200006 / CBS 805.95 / DAOM BR144) TaxID=431595 RepID=K3WSZ1_GLOUD
PFARDPELDQSLSALLRQPVDTQFSPLDVQLQRASAKCRELGIHTLVLSKQTETSAEDENGDDERRGHAAYCRKVRYVRQLRERHRRTHRELHDLDQQQQEQEGEEEASETIQRTRDIVTRDVSDVDLQEFFEKYAETSQPVVLTPPSPPAAAGTLEGPPSSESLGFVSEEELTAFKEACFDLRATKRAPLQLRNAKCRDLLGRFRVPVFVAHNYVHRTNVSLAETFLPALVRVSANANEIVSCPFGLHMLAITLLKGTTVVNVFDQRFEPLFPHSRGSDVEEIEVSATSGGLFGRSTVESTSGDLRNKLSPEYHIGTLLPAHSVLFVPGSKLATMRAAGMAASDQRFLQFCFVDASNFNAVKQELSTEALVNGEAHTLLLSLLSPAFDRSMPRRVQPSDLLWPNYITWPKETKFLKKSDLMNSEGGNEQLQLSRRERLKQWQDDKRWERRIETLTLPVSLPPVVVNITRTTAALRWQDLELDAAANSMNITRKHIVRSALPTTLFGDDFDGHDIEGVASGLAAETKYTFSVQIFVDDTLGLESFGSRVAQTSPCSEPSGIRGVPKASDLDTTCAKLQWLDPIDDGGKPVGLYLISMRQVQDSVDALDLITSYGPEVVVLALSTSIPIRENEASASARGVRLVLSDVNEKVVFQKFGEDEKDDNAEMGSEVSFDVWSAHYSPRAFHVSAEIVRADPLDASTPLRNADQVRDRIVFVSRGGVPFVFKAHYAQLAGALGVIIADVNNTCHGRFDQRCVPGGDKSRGEGFAAQDRHVLWEQNRIPCVLALHEASQQLLELVTP